MPATRFFQENKTEIYELDCDGNEFEIFEGMRIYIERNGRPYNYLSSIDELNVHREEHLSLEEKEKRDKDEQAKRSSEQSQQELVMNLEKLADKRLIEIIKHMNDLKQTDSLNMRQFLMKYII